MAAVIIIGVITSVVGSLILAGLVRLSLGIWRRMHRGDPDVSELAGTWTTTFSEDGKEKREKVKVRQKGSRVEGEIVVREDPQDEGDTYAFEGTYRNLILTGTYESTNLKPVEHGVFLLRRTDVEELSGQYLFSRIGKGGKPTEIIRSDYKWNKG